MIPRSCKKMHADWLDDFCANEMTHEQKKKKRSSQSSAFNAYLWRNFGGTAFVMAVWQTGISWAPSAHMMNNNYNGALEHIAHNFGQWAQRLCRARAAHQEHPKTKEAQRSSGAHQRGKHSLTEEELRNRKARDKARRDYHWALSLDSQLQASNRKGKEEDNGKSLPKKKYTDLTDDEQWWLDELWTGRLEKELERAGRLCEEVQAKDFCVFDHE